MQTKATPEAGHYPVIVIGGGQAGLSVSHHLRAYGIPHLIIEKNETGYAWAKERWDSFCLVTPNWQCQLPGFPYPGPDPEGFMLRDQIVDYVRAYRAMVDPLMLERTEVTSLTRAADGRFELATDAGPFTADCVVVAIGNYHRPAIPRLAERLPRQIHQLHSRDYRNPAALPEGAVLVVGSGQSGCQIAEDLHLAGRQVHLCVGKAPKSPRRYRGRDAVAWLHDMGHYDVPVEKHPLKEGVRRKANHYLTGRDGGHEIDLRLFAQQGMQLHGRLLDVDGLNVELAPDLAANLDAADAVSAGIKAAIDRHILEAKIEASVEAPYQAPWAPASEHTDLDLEAANITSVVWATGFASDFSFVKLPVFDGSGYPTHRRGITTMPDLAFIGLPWLHSWGSGRFAGIARDAAFIARHLRDRLSRRPTRSTGAAAVPVAAIHG